MAKMSKGERAFKLIEIATERRVWSLINDVGLQLKNDQSYLRGSPHEAMKAASIGVIMMVLNALEAECGEDGVRDALDLITDYLDDDNH